jgi:hypothetical protein
MRPAGAFTSLLDIREYLAGTSVQCLVCGKRYLRLTYKHLEMHDLTADGYRERFGIPWTYSLTSAVSRANTSRMQKPINQVNLTYRRHPGQSTADNRPAPPAARAYWRDTIRPQGPRRSAQMRVVVPCDDCGTDVPTTQLTSAHGTRCKACRPRAKELRDLAKAALQASIKPVNPLPVPAQLA